MWQDKVIESTSSKTIPSFDTKEYYNHNNKLGDRFNKGKLQWNLVDFPSFEPMVKVLEFGASKYSAHNWKKGLKVTETIDSMLRHLFALLNGEDNDPESGLSHIGHIQCNAMFLAFMLKNRQDLDDRHKIEA